MTMTRADIETFLREYPKAVPSKETLERALAGDERAAYHLRASLVMGYSDIFFGESQLKGALADSELWVVDDPLTTYMHIICAAHNLYIMDEIAALKTRFHEDSQRILAKMI